MPEDLSPKYQITIPAHAYWRQQIKCQDACPVHTDARGYVSAIAGASRAPGRIAGYVTDPTTPKS